MGATALALTAAAMIHPPLLELVPAALVVGLTSVGSWRLWSHQRVAAGWTEPVISLPEHELDDDCELATFSALQDAAELVAGAMGLVGGQPGSEAILERGLALQGELDAFVFTGDGMGDLATAWRLEDAARSLAGVAAGHPGRRAA
jgi:hypothetical protein